MKHIELGNQTEPVRQFVLSLDLEPDGSMLELDGQPIARVVPPREPVDREQLKAAILARRDQSRKLNDDWHDADHEIWEKS